MLTKQGGALWLFVECTRCKLSGEKPVAWLLACCVGKKIQFCLVVENGVERERDSWLVCVEG